jgi:hypothetical protein
MGNQQYEFGEGRVWSFEASVATTSGLLCYIQGGKVRGTTAASQHVIGISLVPASAGRQVSIGVEGVYNVLITGAAVVAGDLLGSDTSGHAGERTHGAANQRRYDAGIALETIANGARGKVKLLW